jgi:predicted S18 family serine protease
MISHRSMHPDLPESSVTTEVILIGFGEESRQASLVPTKVSAIFPGHGRIIGVDSESKKLESAMELARACLLTLRPQLRILNNCDYYISAQTHGKAIGDPRSASLGFVIGLVNILLILAQRQPLVGVASTGAVDIDGTVLPVSWVSEKVEAASQVPFVKQIYTPDNVKHVEDVLHQFSFG